MKNTEIHEILVIERTEVVKVVTSDWLASCFGNDGCFMTLF